MIDHLKFNANHHKIKYTVAGAMRDELNDNEIYAKEQRL